MSTPDLNNILEAKELSDELTKALPTEWNELIRSHAGHFPIVGDDGKVRFVPARFFSKKCAGELPVLEEVLELGETVRRSGKVVALMTDPGYIVLPEFPADKEPTLEEFFLGNFDINDVARRALLVVYAHVEA